MRRKYIWVTDLKWSLRAVRMQIWNRLRLDDGCPALPTQADFTLPTTSVQKNWRRKKLLEIWDMLFRESENCCWRLRNRVMQIGTGQDWTSVVLLPKLISLCWAPHLFEPEPLQQILAQWHTAADLFAGFYITLCSPKTQYKPPDVLQYIWTYVGYKFKMWCWHFWFCAVVTRLTWPTSFTLHHWRLGRRLWTQPSGCTTWEKGLAQNHTNEYKHTHTQIQKYKNTQIHKHTQIHK